MARARFALSPASPGQVKATLADMRRRRREAQPSGIKTFGSTFKNPPDPRPRDAAPASCWTRPAAVACGSAAPGFSEKHANFVENHGSATTAEVIEVMAEGRRRVKQRFGIELEPEVQSLGPVPIPSDWRHA